MKSSFLNCDLIGCNTVGKGPRWLNELGRWI